MIFFASKLLLKLSDGWSLWIFDDFDSNSINSSILLRFSALVLVCSFFNKQNIYLSKLYNKGFYSIEKSQLLTQGQFQRNFHHKRSHQKNLEFFHS